MGHFLSEEAMKGKLHWGLVICRFIWPKLRASQTIEYIVKSLISYKMAKEYVGLSQKKGQGFV